MNYILKDIKNEMLTLKKEREKGTNKKLHMKKIRKKIRKWKKGGTWEGMKTQINKNQKQKRKI